MSRGVKEFYRDRDGDWRWRVRAANGCKIADSGEGYRRFKDCKNGMWVTFMVMLFGKTRILGRAEK